MAVLGDFGNEQPADILTKIVQRLEETKTDETTLKKHYRQLRILAKLRKLELKFDDMIQNMEKHLDVKNDYLFIRGQQTEQTKFVRNLLTESDFSIDKIADIAGVSVDFVKSVQKQLSEK